MKIIYSPYHVRHCPPAEILNGERTPHAEVPDRIEHIKDALTSAYDFPVVYPHRFPRTCIEKTHATDYVDYIAEAGRSAGAGYVYPSVFSYAQADVQNEMARRGKYSYDLYTPVNMTTYEAARQSAMCALTGASLVRRGEPVAYALCRPPGHHAEYARMGGYCYFNNAAVAAHYLSDYGTVAILDVDLHHGNGTQSLFYRRSDIFFISIHAHPDIKFPYFTGFETEEGDGEGKGYTVNMPLGQGTTDMQFHRALERSVHVLRTFAPTYLIVSVGYDTHKDDPIGAFCLSTRYFSAMAVTIASLDIPTLLVQEGGYNTSKLGDNAVSFVGGFIRSH